MSPYFYDAAFLPSILIPGKRTVQYLRWACARYQTDSMLIYRADYRTFQGYRLFSNNETCTYCSVKAVLLDIRSGLIPSTATW